MSAIIMNMTSKGKFVLIFIFIMIFFNIRSFISTSEIEDFFPDCVIVEVQYGDSESQFMCLTQDGYEVTSGKKLCVGGFFNGGEIIIFSHWSVKICPLVKEFAEEKTLFALGYQMDINKVSASDLEILDGIGQKLAKKIIDYRELYGNFKSINDLLNVSGIGKKKLEKIKIYLTISN